MSSSGNRSDFDKMTLWNGPNTLKDRQQLSRSLASIDNSVKGCVEARSYIDQFQAHLENVIREAESMRYLADNITSRQAVDSLALDLRRSLIRIASLERYSEYPIAHIAYQQSNSPPILIGRKRRYTDYQQSQLTEDIDRGLS